MIDAVHVIACNRDRWQLQRQMQLFALLGYTGDYRIYCNETGEQRVSWRHWFRSVSRSIDWPGDPPRVFAKIPQEIANTPPYHRQQYLKLWDIHTHGDAISLDCKTWPIHPQAWKGRVGVAHDHHPDPENSPFGDTLLLGKQLWNINNPSVGVNLPPQYLEQHTLDAMTNGNWHKFAATLVQQTWRNGQNPSEYWLYQMYQRHNNLQPHQRNNVDLQHITLHTYWGSTKQLKRTLRYNQSLWFTTKWHNTQETQYIPNRDAVYDTIQKHIIKTHRPRC